MKAEDKIIIKERILHLWRIQLEDFLEEYEDTLENYLEDAYRYSIEDALSDVICDLDFGEGLMEDLFEVMEQVTQVSHEIDINANSLKKFPI